MTSSRAFIFTHPVNYINIIKVLLIMQDIGLPYKKKKYYFSLDIDQKKRVNLSKIASLSS